MPPRKRAKAVVDLDDETSVPLASSPLQPQTSQTADFSSPVSAGDFRSSPSVGSAKRKRPASTGERGAPAKRGRPPGRAAAAAREDKEDEDAEEEERPDSEWDVNVVDKGPVDYPLPDQGTQSRAA
jgi:hypothetical protein